MPPSQSPRAVGLLRRDGLAVAGGSWRPLFSSAFPVLACPAASRSFPFVGAARAVVGASPRFKKRAPDARLRKGGELSV